MSGRGAGRSAISALLALLGWLCLGPAAVAQDAPEIFREVSVPGLSAGAAAAELQGPNVVRSRYVEVDLDRVLAAGAAQSPRPGRARGVSGKRLTFNLFADAVQEFEEDHAVYSDDGQSYAWYGRPTTPGGGEALLVVSDGAVAGSVKTASGEFYRIRSVSSNVQVIRQVAYQGSPAIPDAVPVPDSEVPQAAQAQQATAEQSGATTLDVMVVYTAGARQAAGGTAGIQSEIQLAIAELNQSFNSSGVQMQARLAHSAEISYGNEQADLSTSLARLRTPGDGYLDDVHAMRDQYGADVVALLVNGPGSSGGTVGTGYIMQTVGSYFSAYAFSVTEVNFATGPAYALLHEIGHNLGCAHDRANASSAGAYSYSYGYQRATTPRFRTIMSYNCSGVNCPTINNWSNPDASYNGYATGVSSSASSSADNRQTLNNTKATAAAWREAGGSGGGSGGGGGGGSSNLAPTAVSVSPASGSGSSKTFGYTFSDGNGYADIPAVQMLINSALRANGGCYLYYSRSANRVYLMNDAGSTWLGSIVLGSSGTLQNSQCQVNGSGSSSSASGNNLTVNVAVSFQAGFAGSKVNYMLAQDSAGLSSGWQSKGSWTASAPSSSQPPPSQNPTPQQAAPPQATSVSPSSGSSSSKTFSYVFTDPNGASDIGAAQILLNSTLQPVAACYIYVARAANMFYLSSNAGSSWLGPVTFGSSATLSNNQCSISAASSSLSASGNALTVQLAATFSSGFAGSKNNYMWVNDSTGRTSSWQLKGSWSVPGGSSGGGGSGGGGSSGGGGGSGGANQAPSIAGVNPSAGSGSSRAFTFSFADPNGFADIPAAQMLIGSALNAGGSCYLYYSRTANMVYLMNDAGNGWLTPISLGSSASIGNSQCIVNGAGSSATAGGTSLAVTFSINFKPGFSGGKRTFMLTQDAATVSTGWQQVGTWSVP
jgi:peptidyl-Asp metalloendopeptidase